MFSSNASQVSNDVAYIEDVFSTYLYTGNNSTQTITNGVDLAGKGGMIWFKPRSNAASHVVFDTVRGPTKFVVPNSASFGEITNTVGNDLTSFNSNGFSLGPSQTSSVNVSGYTQVAWTFRKQPKFFDVVTYTGNGVAGRTVAHSLGSTPGTVIVKCTSQAYSWFVYHRSTGADKYLLLQTTGSAQTDITSAIWNNTSPTSTVFTVGAGDAVNQSGETYVAYLFAHDAGGFGLSGNENVVSCGSYTVSNSAQITLGYEPQFIIAKVTSGFGSSWFLLDSMRDFSLTNSAYLRPNSSGAEISSGSPGIFIPTATGFIADNTNQLFTNGDNVIYIAIRRGPMAVPTDGTKVFSPNTVATIPSTFNIGFPLDLIVNQPRNGTGSALWGTRLQGPYQYLDSSSTAAEVTAGTAPWAFDKQNDSYAYYSGTSVAWNFRRAPSFFDEVCYTSTSDYKANFSHNLGVTPQLIIFKARANVDDWMVYTAATGNNSNLVLNNSQGSVGQTGFISTLNATSVVTGSSFAYNNTASVAYLFATCAGVSKVGSYTGTGTTQAIACGFTAGARFVMIKRTDAAGDWYVWDSARGIVAGNDPYLLLNSTAAETTGTDYIDPVSSGFEISSTAPAAINASGGSYIFLAVA